MGVAIRPGLVQPVESTDSDGDFLTDLLEYAFGGHPLIPDEDQVAPVYSVQGPEEQRFLTITFQRRKESVTLGYRLLESETLEVWEPVDLNSQIIPPTIDLGNGMESVTVRGEHLIEGPGARPQGFMKIGVERTR